MKVVLTAINAKYIHSNLAVHYLKSYSKEYEEQIEIAEYTINHHVEDVIGNLYRKNPDFVGFSCYIWNINMVYEVAKELRKVLPHTKIWLGGPEVSYDAIEVLEGHSYIDGVMVGEGEETFRELMAYYIDQQGRLENISGIAYQAEGSIAVTSPRAQMNMSEAPFVYQDMEAFKNKIIYYESSRGCPYSCSYCLSSIDKRVRLRDVEMVKKELQFFLDNKVPQVKFVDRTFNCHPTHTLEIWKYIHEHDNGITNFHMEVSADILREEEFEILNQMRPGLVQLEIGVQSTNPATIEAIRRKMDLTKLKRAVERVKSGKNVHQHLDLIIGLPYEDYETFQTSFNEVYAMEPDQLQIGFLKVLKGSYMHECVEKYGIVYKDAAPYEVLYTKWISYGEVLRLKAVEEMVEVYYNSGQFPNTMKYLVKFFATPFAMYEAIADYYEANGLFERSHSRAQRYEILYTFCKETIGRELEVIAQLLTYDSCLREKMKNRPDFALEAQEEYQDIVEKLQEASEAGELGVEGMQGVSVRRLLKLMHFEQFTIDLEKTVATKEPVYEKQVVLFDYKQRNPLNHDAKTLVWKK